MMKTFSLVVVGLILCLCTYSQNMPAGNAQTVDSLKSYLKKNIKYPAIAIKDYTEGSMVISFKINDKQMIDEIRFVRHLTSECDSAVLNAIGNYSNTTSLAPANYIIGLKFFLLNGIDGKPDGEIKPFDKSRYKNFLFEVNVIDVFPSIKVKVPQYR